ncbi:MAG: hypothetical protein P4L22_07295 [Candidatus Babeliales bacterium]|nr:hypothetical protein [Candidatus Babeliales bacterium]
MNKNQIKLSLTLLILCNLVTSNLIYAGNGGNVAAGVLGGLAGGAMLGAAMSRPSTREVVYVENEVRPNRLSRKDRELRQWEQDLRQQERELIDWEQDLNNKEQKLASQKRELERRECALNQRERSFKNTVSPKTTIITTKEIAG